MKHSEAALRLIEKFEGFRAVAYRCPAGVLSIGFGTTKDVKPGQTVTREEALRFLSEDVEQFEKHINEAVKVPLTQHQFDALVSFVYNVGPYNFRQSTLLKKLNAGDYEGASEQFGKWVKAGGMTLEGLVKRRAAERALFESKP